MKIIFIALSLIGSFPSFAKDSCDVRLISLPGISDESVKKDIISAIEAKGYTLNSSNQNGLVIVLGTQERVIQHHHQQGLSTLDVVSAKIEDFASYLKRGYIERAAVFYTAEYHDFYINNAEFPHHQYRVNYTKVRAGAKIGPRKIDYLIGQIPVCE